MISYRIQLFARAKDLAGTDQVTLTLPSGVTVGQARQALAEACPALRELLPKALFAVNNEYADEQHPLPPAAELALLPPVSGGSSPNCA